MVKGERCRTPSIRQELHSHTQAPKQPHCAQKRTDSSDVFPQIPDLQTWILPQWILSDNFRANSKLTTTTLKFVLTLYTSTILLCSTTKPQPNKHTNIISFCTKQLCSSSQMHHSQPRVGGMSRKALK